MPSILFFSRFRRDLKILYFSGKKGTLIMGNLFQEIGFQIASPVYDSGRFKPASLSLIYGKNVAPKRWRSLGVTHE
ncbi:hypothetical protein LEP1GSC192_2177 [Leptospira sp. B5-022]|nr:hypothetical protein LEP1GSC192_2177 [Leptospira sp. B5-022]